ncbi:MAG: hypothetical protein ACTS6G_00640 [Candidatus Hodgkinia cicadicola]
MRTITNFDGRDDIKLAFPFCFKARDKFAFHSVIASAVSARSHHAAIALIDGGALAILVASQLRQANVPFRK